LTRNGVVAIAAAISPYRAIRDEVREQIGRFVEVYMECPIETLAERDVKGLYKQALAGKLDNFTGVSDPYEPPMHPEVVCYSDGRETPEQSAAKVIAKLQHLGYIERRELATVASNGHAAYDEDEEAEVTGRLRELGYI
jgi:adenylylsulfate kinase-like enzyme